MKTSIGARFAVERKALGLTQAEAATVCGVSREVVGRWERDVNAPPGEALAAFAAKGADVSYILTGKGKQTAAGGPASGPPTGLPPAEEQAFHSGLARMRHAAEIIEAVATEMEYLPENAWLTFVHELLMNSHLDRAGVRAAFEGLRRRNIPGQPR